jgi:hypothetical protein
MGEGRSFTRRAAGNQKIDTRFDLPRYEIAQGGIINGTVLMKGSNQRCPASPHLHVIKIARIERRCEPIYRFTRFPDHKMR